MDTMKTESDMTTELSNTCTTMSATVIASSVPTAVPSTSPASPGSPPPPGGGESRPLSGRLTPPSLTPAQEQMLLGTMLGDGSMAVKYSPGGNPVYRSQHGWIQHAYNCRKHQTLSEFARLPPRKKPNYGFGKWLSVWQTLSCPALWPIASLCLQNGKKRVTQAWLDRLTWEGISWWYQDDGSLTLRNTTAEFHTEGFSGEECELIARWLSRKMGIKCHAHPTKRRRGPGVYWTIRLTVDSTLKLMEKIKPHAHASMAYKFETTPIIQLTCPHCGSPVPTRHYRQPNGMRLTCGSPACIKAYRTAAKTKYAAVPENREKALAAARDVYAAGGETRRAKEAERAAAWRADNPQTVRKIKQRHLRKVQEARKLRPWTCRECGATRPLGALDTRTRYCSRCRPIVSARQKAESARRHPRHPRS